MIFFDKICELEQLTQIDVLDEKWPALYREALAEKYNPFFVPWVENEKVATYEKQWWLPFPKRSTMQVSYDLFGANITEVRRKEVELYYQLANIVENEVNITASEQLLLKEFLLATWWNWKLKNLLKKNFLKHPEGEIKQTNQTLTWEDGNGVQTWLKTDGSVVFPTQQKTTFLLRNALQQISKKQSAASKSLNWDQKTLTLVKQIIFIKNDAPKTKLNKNFLFSLCINKNFLAAKLRLESLARTSPKSLSTKTLAALIPDEETRQRCLAREIDQEQKRSQAVVELVSAIFYNTHKILKGKTRVIHRVLGRIGDLPKKSYQISVRYKNLSYNWELKPINQELFQVERPRIFGKNIKLSKIKLYNLLTDTRISDHQGGFYQLEGDLPRELETFRKNIKAEFERRRQKDLDRDLMDRPSKVSKEQWNQACDIFFSKSST